MPNRMPAPRHGSEKGGSAVGPLRGALALTSGLSLPTTQLWKT